MSIKNKIWGHIWGHVQLFMKTKSTDLLAYWCKIWMSLSLVLYDSVLFTNIIKTKGFTHFI